MTTPMTKVTNVGRARITNSIILGEMLSITRMALASTEILPSADMVELPGVVWTGNLTSLDVSPTDAGTILARLAVPVEAGTWTIRSAALLDDQDNLIAVASLAATEKEAGFVAVTVTMAVALTSEDIAGITLIPAGPGIQADEKGQPGGVATLDNDQRLQQQIRADKIHGVIPAVNLPSYVDDVLEFANLAAFPLLGEMDVIYVAIDTNKTYRWSGSAYIELGTQSVFQYANFAAFPATGAGATLYLAADTGITYWWTGAGYAIILSSLFGAPNGAATLDSSGVVPDVQLPSYAYANLAAFPPVGASGKIYLALDTWKLYTPVAGPAYQEVSAGLSYLVESRSIAAPNATVPAHLLTPTAAEADIDLVLQPKGTAALLMTVPDNGVAGGSKRGLRAIDLQAYRTASAMVASGTYAIIVGSSNQASNTKACAIGDQNTVSGNTSYAVGLGNTVSATWSIAFGRSNTVSGGQSWAVGETNTVVGGNCGAFGQSNNLPTSVSSYSYLIGKSNTAIAGRQSFHFGESNYAGGVLIGKQNDGSGGSALGNYAFGSTNSIQAGVFVGNGNIQSGNNGVCYAFGAANTYTSNAQVMSLGRNNVAGDAWDTTIIGNLATVHAYEDFALIRSLRRIEVAKTSHVREVHPGGITTDATVTELLIGVAATHGVDSLTLIPGTTNMITANFVAISAADRKSWKVEASVYQANSVSVPVIDVQTITEVYESAGATAWNLTLSTPSNYQLNFDATGVAATTIKWLGKVEITQLQL